MEKVFQRPKSMPKTEFHYCPGCSHQIIHRLVGEIIDELEIQNKTVGIAPVGCAVLAYDYWDIDMSEAAHGRVPAVATGIKKVHPDSVVFGYQGDGDLAAIGLAETVHAANRGENITIIFVNNAIYGMTGGQMAPTTMPGQKTATTPKGRNVEEVGHPIRVCELLSTLATPSYIERVSVIDPSHIIKAKKALKKAFTYQLEGRGYSFVEVVSTCPTGWGLSPVQACEWVKDTMLPYYNLGCYKDYK
jgi:2-oxoglutarate ferredoxin oxidoreductase subunit beta